MRLKSVLLASLVAASLPAAASFRLNESLLNPNGTDDNYEFVEIVNTAGGAASLAGLWLLAIDGDTGQEGLVDYALNLGAYSTGTNGLLLIRDRTGSSTVNPYTPAVSAATSVVNIDLTGFENNSTTLALVQGYSGLIGSDIDANDDGIIDNVLWTGTIDAISVRDREGTPSAIDLTESSYGVQLGGVQFDAPTLNFDAVGWTRFQDGGIAAYALYADGTQRLGYTAASLGGPYLADSSRMVIAGPGAAFDFVVTPGGVNPVPEPATVLALAGGALALLRRKRA